jgi:NADPH2:quinone reductase
MKAYGFTEYGHDDVQTFLELDPPTPKAGELLVEVKSAGVNPADWKIREGMFGHFHVFPAVLGAEVSGIVREVGYGVTDFAVGDEVFGAAAPGCGGYAEYTLLTAEASAHKPERVSFTAAATLSIAAATAYDGVTQLHLEPGQTLLINGVSGGVGVAAAQIARDLGINVIGTASPDRAALVRSLGATHVPYGPGVADRVREIARSAEPRIDAIFDLAGGEGLRAVAGLLSDRAKLISSNDPATAGELGGHFMTRDHSSRPLDIVARLVAEGRLDPHVTDIRPLDEAPGALATVEHGHPEGKVVIEV